MTTKGPESKVKDEIKKQLMSLGDACWWYMPVAGPYSVAGIPDFVGIYRGYGFGIEAKADAGRLTPHQRMHISRISTAGGFGAVVRGVDDARQVAKNLREFVGESCEGKL